MSKPFDVSRTRSPSGAALTRRQSLGLLAGVAAAGMTHTACWSEKRPPSLRKLAAGKPLIGVALPGNFQTSFSDRESKILRRHFDSVTPENVMKWTSLCPREGEYNWDPVDRMLDVTEGLGMKFVGHCLIFNRKRDYPEWVFYDGEKEAEAPQVWKRIETHMEKVMGRYRGRVDSWDVLNEFVEVKPPHYRETDFTRVLGPDFPVRLFKLARQLDPEAKLTYNDFGIEKSDRRAMILKFIRTLLDQGCQIDVVGSQSHLEVNRDFGEQLADTIQEFSALGVKCAFTELDVDVIPRSSYWNMKTREEAVKQDPYTHGCPPEVLDEQARIYREFFEAVAAHRNGVDRVTLWGLSDKYSWLNTWPWKRTNYGLLFDRQGNPKPAFHAVASAL